MDKHKQLFLKWWYCRGGREECGYPTKKPCAKDVFIAHRTIWEQVQCYITNSSGVQLTHDEIKRLCIRLDKDGILACNTYEDVSLSKAQRDANRKDTGFAEGREGFIDRAATIADNLRKVPEAYKRYIKSASWRNRSQRYLDECCRTDAGWVCEMCGKVHNERHTIHVHHNTYDKLDGKELDEHLMACCSGFCHDMADISRNFNAHNYDYADMCDKFRTLWT